MHIRRRAPEVARRSLGRAAAQGFAFRAPYVKLIGTLQTVENYARSSALNRQYFSVNACRVVQVAIPPADVTLSSLLPRPRPAQPPPDVCVAFRQFIVSWWRRAPNLGSNCQTTIIIVPRLRSL
ncbi:hypothetical protein EVAR_49131_1 [Eumeta japonica]|uniref:Uncharacterized protein n=1 Tax=Eumeta variegata TaxID=151549 RepID=A0A4C1YPM3_EUMVA|nr:hypothetical protein EVAR_49131_1 [Eumeta japonica]